MIINVKYAVIGRELRLVENVHFEITNETITHIGDGKSNEEKSINFKSGVAIPALTNSHIHPFDYAFIEAGLNLNIKEVVEEPNGLKHKLLAETSAKKLEKAINRVLSLQISQGVLATVSFCELGFKGALIARNAARNLPLRNIILGRPYKKGLELTEELAEILNVSDGLGLSTPLIYDSNILRLMSDKASGKIVATHISETEEKHRLRDFEIAVKYLKPDFIVHGVHLNREQIAELAKRKISIVFCPRSNMWFSVGLPPIAEALRHRVNISLGTDNTGWVNPDIWREMETAWNIIRLRGNLEVKPSEILKMATVNPAKGLKLSRYGVLEEGFEASFVILDSISLNLNSSHDKLAAIVKRGGSETVIAVYFKGKEVLRKISC